MLSVSGLIAVLDEPQERTSGKNKYISFLALAKDAFGKAHKYKASLYCWNDEQLQKARENIKRGKVILVRYGGWSAQESVQYPGKMSNFLNLQWNNIQVLGWFENRKEKQ